MRKICMSFFLAGLLASIADSTSAQITIGANLAPDPSAVLDIRATNKGMLLPQVSMSSTNTWGLAGATPAEGMVIYNTNSAVTGTGAQGAGCYIWTSGMWKKMVSATDISGDNLGNHTATQKLNMTNHDIDSIAAAKIFYQATIYERTMADRSGNYALYGSNGSFRIWSSKGNTDRFVIDSTGKTGVGTGVPKNKFSVVGGPISQDDWSNGDKFFLLGVSGANKITLDAGSVTANYAGQITDANNNPTSNTLGAFNWYTGTNGAWVQRMNLANDGSFSVTGTAKIGKVPLAAATDSILTADPAGNVHKMAQTAIAASTKNITSVSAATYTVADPDNVIIVDATSNSVTITIPAATAATKGRCYTVKRIDNTANDVFVDFGSSHIDTATDTKLSVGNNVGIQFINLNTSQWYTLSKF